MLVKFWRKNRKLLVSEMFGFLITGGVSWYVSCYLQIMIKAHKIIFNPTAFHSFISRYGFPSAIFSALWGAMGLLVAATIWRGMRGNSSYDAERNFKYSDSGVYGTAKMLEESEMQDVAKAQPITEATGNILGQFDTTGNRVVNMKNKIRYNRHICVLGASSSGKTFSFVLPNMMQFARRRESVIVTDPKGEIYETTSEYFRSLGYVVRRFDMKQPELSDGWHCLKEVFADTPTAIEDRAAIFADIVISNTAGLSGSGGVFEDGPKMLLKALLLRVALDSSKKEDGTQHIGTCVDYIKNDAGSAYLDDVVFQTKDVPMEAQACLTAYNSFRQASQNLYGNMVLGLSSRLQAFDSTTVKEVMKTDDIDLTLPGKRPCVYYCIMSDQHRTRNFLTALFFSFLFLDLVEFADAQPGKRCPVPVNFMMDEFANIGTLGDFDQKMAVIRSRGLNVSIILQDINQLETRYPKTYKSILSNCATHLCIGFNDSETQDYYAHRSGDTTIKVRTDQHGAIEPLIQLGRKHSTGDGRRSILASDELGRTDIDDCYVFWQGHNPLKLHKFPITSHPEYDRLVPCRAEDYPSIMDKDRREELRKKEAEYISKYDAWIKDGGDPFPGLRWKEEEKTRRAFLRQISDKIKQFSASLSEEEPEDAEDDIYDLDDNAFLDITGEISQDTEKCEVTFSDFLEFDNPDQDNDIRFSDDLENDSNIFPTDTPEFAKELASESSGVNTLIEGGFNLGDDIPQSEEPPF